MTDSRARYRHNRATSKAGADHANRTLSLRQRAVLAVIVANDGATIAEIARELGTDKSAISGRITELREDHKVIVDSGERRATVSNVAGIVWKLVPAWQAAKDSADVFHVTSTTHTPKLNAPASEGPQLLLEVSR